MFVLAFLWLSIIEEKPGYEFHDERVAATNSALIAQVHTKTEELEAELKSDAALENCSTVRFLQDEMVWQSAKVTATLDAY